MLVDRGDRDVLRAAHVDGHHASAKAGYLRLTRGAATGGEIPGTGRRIRRSHAEEFRDLRAASVYNKKGVHGPPGAMGTRWDGAIRIPDHRGAERVSAEDDS